MAWATAASFAELCMRRVRRVRSSKALSASSSTALRSPEMRTQPMVPVSTPVSQQRSERRIAVRLPLRVRGRDKRGVIFEEETSSENLCRNGAAFLTRFDIAIGSDPDLFGGAGYNKRSAVTRNDIDFATQGRVVHVHDSPAQGEKLVGVQFTGPRFQRFFRSESAA